MTTTAKPADKPAEDKAERVDDAPVQDAFAGRYDPAPVMGRHPEHPHEDGSFDPGYGPR